MSSLEDLAKQAKAAKEFIDHVSQILKQASRSALIEVTNATTQTLKVHRTANQHGAFANDALPASSIEPMQSNVFGARSVSGGVMVGTEGRVWYSIGSTNTHFYIHWDVPFLGENDINWKVEGDGAAWFDASGVRSGGDKKAKFRFIIGEKALYGPSDTDWSGCGECKGLFYRINSGKCPGRPDPNVRPVVVGNGVTVGEPSYLGHIAAGPHIKLFHTQPGPGREGGWRRCKRCKQLFFDGYEAKGVCPKWRSSRPGHVAEGPQYFLPFDMTPRARQWNDWRFCTKCYVLFYFPHNQDGSCAAGGIHRAHAFNYIVDALS